ncbi:transmembrane protein 45b [Plakobranchus ocellatus]|uniref:Transmembrane protein 45b n=1 Tax=Plakobranchus ocellatus TaxID=259542 RepID=A0AAV4DDN2_9GAST|nr:transmembrane protein 45b [Plakobranchus ocellatus]
MEPALRMTINESNIYEDQNLTDHTDYIPGTISGHALPVAGWLLVGLSHLILTFKHFYDCKGQSSKFTSSAEIPLRLSGRGCLRLQTVPLTAAEKIVIGGAYFLRDVIFANLAAMSTAEVIPHLQHDTMAANFALSGVVDLLRLYPRTRWLLPGGIDYALFSMAFLTEVQQFVSHLHGRTPVDMRLHQLQASVAAFTVMILAAEARFRQSVELPAIRALLLILQGTWMCHLMLILYHPLGLQPWDLHSDHSVAMVSLMFAWHVILLVIFVFVVNLGFVYLYSSSTQASRSKSKYTKCPSTVISSMAFLTEVQQFVSHLHGRTPVDVRLHLLQASVAAFTVMILAAEARFRQSVELPVIRALLLILQGTWMCHLMLILYHPLGLQPWDLYSDHSVAMVSLMFAWHVILLVIFVFVVNLGFVYLYSSSMRASRSKSRYTKCPSTVKSS